MKKFYKHLTVSVPIIGLMLGFAGLIIVSPAVHAAPTPVDLGTATPFAILAGTPNITDAGNTSVINGNVGLSPATGAGIGLLCSQVTGTIYSVDAAGPLPCRQTNPSLLTGAKNDLTAAFIDVAGRTPVTTVPTELGGTTKTAGIYDSASTTFGITAGAGALVLDGQGDPSSVFIFEMDAAGTGLTVGPGSTVSLINGAQACNVFWRVDTATLDTGAVFKGNILALNSITVANGTNIEGRLLARNGNVTLDNDVITIANCAATSGGGSSSDGSTPTLPNTGNNSNSGNTPWNVIIPTGVMTTFTSLYLLRKKRTI